MMSYMGAMTYPITATGLFSQHFVNVNNSDKLIAGCPPQMPSNSKRIYMPWRHQKVFAHIGVEVVNIPGNLHSTLRFQFPLPHGILIICLPRLPAMVRCNELHQVGRNNYRYQCFKSTLLMMNS